MLGPDPINFLLNNERMPGLGMAAQAVNVIDNAPLALGWVEALCGLKEDAQQKDFEK
jgi:hypothetical protein